MKLLWDGESFLEVTVPPSFKNRLCGLCGNFNGRRRDALRMESGQMAKSINQFGNSWGAGGPKSCSRPDPPPASASGHSNALVATPSPAAQGSTGGGGGGARQAPAVAPLCQRQWEVRIRAVKECNTLRAVTFAACHHKVSPVRYFK